MHRRAVSAKSNHFKTGQRNVINMVGANILHVESYLSGRLDKNDEAQEDSNERDGHVIGRLRASELGDVQKKPAAATQEFDWHPKQRQLKDNIDRRVEQALCARHDEDPDKAERARDQAMEHGQAVVGLGGPGTGKTTMLNLGMRLGFCIANKPWSAPG